MKQYIVKLEAVTDKVEKISIANGIDFGSRIKLERVFIIIIVIVEFTRIQFSDYSTGCARQTSLQCEKKKKKKKSHDIGNPYWFGMLYDVQLPVNPLVLKLIWLKSANQSAYKAIQPKSLKIKCHYYKLMFIN